MTSSWSMRKHILPLVNTSNVWNWNILWPTYSAKYSIRSRITWLFVKKQTKKTIITSSQVSYWIAWLWITGALPLKTDRIFVRMSFAMVTSSNENIFRVTGHLCGEFTGPRWVPHKGQWHGALMFSLIYARIDGWVNTGEAGHLRRHHTHYDVIVMVMRNNSVASGITLLFV